MKEQPLKKPAKKTAMRLPAELHAELQDAAAREDHSMNDEIIARLSAGAGGASMASLMTQVRRLTAENQEIKAELKKTQEMIQVIIDALGPRR